MKALLLLAAVVTSCTLPVTDKTLSFSIEPGAFAGIICKHVNLTNSAHHLIISTNAFSNATGFTEVSIPENTRIIEDYAFSNTSVQHVQFLGQLAAVSDLAFDHLASVAVRCPTYDIRVDMAGDWQIVYRKVVKCDMF